MRKSLFLATAFVLFLSYLAIGQHHNPVHYRNLGNSSAASNSFGGGGTENSTGTSGTGANIDVIYHKIFWRVNPDSATKYIKGSVQTNFKTIVAGVTSVSFDMNSVLVADSVYFRGAKLATGNINRTGNIITITLGATLANNFIDSVTIFYKGPPPAANIPPGAVGYQKTTDAGAGNYIYTLAESYEDRDWWPCKADMQDKIDSMDITISVPWAATAAADTFWAATNGVLIDSSTFYGSGATSSRLFKFKTRYPIASYLVSVAAAKYTRYYRNVTVNGTVIPVVYNLFKGKSAATVNGMLAKLDEQNTTLSVFSSKFGDYPFKNEKHGFYEFGFSGGMEHQTFSGINTASMTNSPILAHELTHQWFGDNVSFSTWNDLWLAEGFASYGEALYYELVANNQASAYSNRNANKTNGLTETVSTWIPNSSCNTSALWNSAYGSSVYDRGGVVVAMLRALAGDTKFYQALTNYQTNLAGKSATTDSLRNFFNAALGVDIDPFFKDYVGGSGAAASAVGGIGNPINTVKWNSPSANKLVLSMGSQTKSATNNVSYFRGPVVVRFTAAGKDTTINFFDWGGGKLSYAGNGMSDTIPGNRLVYNLSFTPTAAVYDDSARTLSTGSMSPDGTLNSFTWTGASNSTWGTAGNWLNSAIPGDGSEVTIATTVNQPVLTANTKFNKLIINAGSVLNLNNFNLTINGSISGTGTITGSAGSGITINKEIGSHTVETSPTSGTLYLTQTSAATRSLANLTINTGGTITLGNAADIGALNLNAASILNIAGNTLTLNGAVTGTGTITSAQNANLIVNGTAGTINFTQTSAATRSLNNLTLNTGGSATLGTALDVYGTIGLTAANLNLNAQNLTLKSTIGGTARIGNLTGSTLSGATNVTVERYLSDVGRRAWRLLSVPVTGSQTIRQAWQENGVNAANLGTNITSNLYTGSNGFDASSGSSSILTHVQGGAGGPSWNGTLANTNTALLSAFPAYMLFVRGDRFATGGNALHAPTVLRATGTIRQGTLAAVNVSATGTGYTLVGNPYPSPIDFETIAGTANLNQSYYLWDAALAGSNGLGGYRVVQRTAPNTYQQTPLILGGTVVDPTIRYIHSGQAFFLKATGADASVVLTEAAKAAIVSIVNPIVQGGANDQQLIVNLMVPDAGNAVSLADGFRISYNENNRPDISDDILKIGNFGENVSSLRTGKSLIVENRPMIGRNDTVFLRLTNLGIKKYRFQIGTIDLVQNNVKAILQDNLQGTNTELDLNSINDIDFEVTANPASSASNRFKIIFTLTTPLPVSFTSINAYQQNAAIAVDWKVTSQTNLLNYEIEKATDGVSFSTAATQAVIGVDGSDAAYSWLDLNPVTGDNYYRIRSMGVAGEIKYSNTVSVKIVKSNAVINIYPNPATGKTINLQFINMDKGYYSLRLLNIMGQVMFTQQFNHNGGNVIKSIVLGSKFVSGNYRMEITRPDNTKMTKNVFVAD